MAAPHARTSRAPALRWSHICGRHSWDAPETEEGRASRSRAYWVRYRPARAPTLTGGPLRHSAPRYAVPPPGQPAQCSVASSWAGAARAAGGMAGAGASFSGAGAGALPPGTPGGSHAFLPPPGARSWLEVQMGASSSAAQQRRPRRRRGRAHAALARCATG